MRLIDADEAKEALTGWGTYPTDGEIEDTIDELPTIEAAPINNNPCGFCGKFNFGDAKAEVYSHGANIVIASALARFPVEEQFNFCPVCGRSVKKGGASND